jgi:hypothetical protein
VGFSVIGALAALLMPGRGHSQAATIVAQPALGGEMG